MAATFTKQYLSADIANGSEGGIIELIGTLNLGTYATGGVAVNFANIHPLCVNSKIVGSVSFEMSADSTYIFNFDAANNKVLAYERSHATQAQAANDLDMSAAAKHCGVTVKFRVSTAVSAAVTV